MVGKVSNNISVLEFECQAPLRFFEHCAACARFGDDCPDLAIGKEILRGKKKISYGNNAGEDNIDIRSFKCRAPLYYFEHTRMKCARKGRCRDEGLLLALLNGKKTLDYSHKDVAELPRMRRRKVAMPVRIEAEEVAVS